MIKRKFAGLISALCVVTLALICSNGLGQTVMQEQKKDIQLDNAARKDIVENTAKILEDYYVFPEKGKVMADTLRANLKSGVYDNLTTPEPLRSRLVQDLQKINPDSHMSLSYFPPSAGFSFISNTETDETKIKEAQDSMERQAKENNFGLVKVEILEGNIGYLKIGGFQSPANLARPALAAAMKFLENSDAIIIDVRVNPGGDPEYVALVSSYFFEGKPVLLNSMYNRPSNTTKEHWTVDVEGRLAGKPLYILTGPASASGAEVLAYDLQSFKKATIVGEKTVGGAHGMSPYLFKNDYGAFAVIVPDARVINAVTKTNWEGVGVKPDIAVEAEKALITAHRLALGEVARSTQNEDVKSRNAQIISKLSFQERKRQGGDLREYAGKYGDREISFDGESLKFKRQGGPEIKMIQVEDDVFQLDISVPDKPRVRFKKENGKVTGFFLERQGGNDVFVEKND